MQTCVMVYFLLAYEIVASAFQLLHCTLKPYGNDRQTCGYLSVLIRKTTITVRRLLTIFTVIVIDNDKSNNIIILLLLTQTKHKN